MPASLLPLLPTAVHDVSCFVHGLALLLERLIEQVVGSLAETVPSWPAHVVTARYVQLRICGLKL